MGGGKSVGGVGVEEMGKTLYNFSFSNITTRGRHLTTRISGQSILTAFAVSFRGENDEGQSLDSLEKCGGLVMWLL